MAKKFKLSIFIFIAALYSFLIWAALDPPIPSNSSPVVFYSNQTRDDLRLVLKKLFSKAQTSIDVTMYAATDLELLRQLENQARKGLQVKIRHDPSNPIDSPLSIPTKAKGLMHRKIVVIDDRIVLLGSANMTTSSLLMHDNLSVAFDHPPLAEFLKKPTASSFDFEINSQKAKVWLLPDPKALLDLQKQLEDAKESIFIAMFTLTHPDLLETLIQRHQKGVKVTIAIDHYAARGASQKAIQRLQSKGVETIFSQGLQLLHHKWAYIDQRKVILGSTNWTKAAFIKNQDCLLFLNTLTKKQQALFNTLESTIRLESNNFL